MDLATPASAWLRSAEVERRFGRRRRDPGVLIPVLRLPSDDARQGAQALAKVLGVRDEFSPAAFRSQDAHVISERIETLYRPGGADGGYILHVEGSGAARSHPPGLP